MAGRKRKQSVEQAETPDVPTDSGPDAGTDSSAPEPAPSKAAAGVPRWRQIEVMHERAQLRRNLDDLVMDFDELEMEVFGSDAEHDLLYRHLGEDDDEDEEDEIEIDDADDDYEDDDYEDLED